MGKQAVIGNPFIFQIRYLDGSNVAFDPTVGPTITIFTYSTAGAKNDLVTAAAMSAVAPADTGRFMYAYTIPSTYDDGTMLYAVIEAEDALANALVDEVEVVLIAATRSGIYNNAGLTANFVEGG